MKRLDSKKLTIPTVIAVAILTAIGSSHVAACGDDETCAGSGGGSNEGGSGGGSNQGCGEEGGSTSVE